MPAGKGRKGAAGGPADKQGGHARARLLFHHQPYALQEGLSMSEADVAVVVEVGASVGPAAQGGGLPPCRPVVMIARLHVVGQGEVGDGDLGLFAPWLQTGVPPYPRARAICVLLSRLRAAQSTSRKEACIRETKVCAML